MRGHYDYVVDARGFVSILEWEDHKHTVELVKVERYIGKLFGWPCDMSDDTCYIVIDPKYTGRGYAWVFPKGNREVNIGGLVGTRWRQALKKYLAVLSEPWFELYSHGKWYIPIGYVEDPTIMGFVVRIGDAAALANPLHGGGIFPAVHSALVATTAIDSRDLYYYRSWYRETYARFYMWLMELRKKVLKCEDQVNCFLDEKLTRAVLKLLKNLDVLSVLTIRRLRLERLFEGQPIQPSVRTWLKLLTLLPSILTIVRKVGLPPK